MIKSRKLSLMVLALTIFLICQAVPAFASVDGQTWETLRSTYLYTSNSTSSAIVMTTGTNEALAYRGSSSNGFTYFMGQKVNYGTVYGYALNTNVATVKNTYDWNYDLNLYSDESESYYSQEVPANVELNVGNHWYQTHKYMKLMQVTDYADFTGYVHQVFGYVHTNFPTGNTSAYYLVLQQ